MLRVTILASGSKGNCTVIASSRTRIMIDAGLSCRELLRRMHGAGEEPDKLNAVLVTHEHQDHIQGLSVLARRLKVPVYFTQATHQAWRRWIAPRPTMSFKSWLAARQARAGQADAIAAVAEPPAEAEVPSTEDAGRTTRADDLAWLPAVEYFQAGAPFEVGDLRITPFTIPHDAMDPVGFVVEAEGMRVAIATDLGYMSPNIALHLRRSDLLMLESNHDLEMLRDGPYPWSVKQRVLSRVGHLSNDAVGEYLSRDYDGGARYIVLAHLSESNNMPELARISAERALNGRMSLLGNRVLLASQSVPLESIYL
jgi:phosphoribosyl 1,2-cyclic phosphodiesterase